MPIIAKFRIAVYTHSLIWATRFLYRNIVTKIINAVMAVSPIMLYVFVCKTLSGIANTPCMLNRYSSVAFEIVATGKKNIATSTPIAENSHKV